MKFKLRARSIWEQGPREKQEDSIYPQHGEITESDRLFILCDGMGGHSAGEIASSTVCSTMSKYIKTNAPEGSFSDDVFGGALEAAYDALDKRENGAAKKMGTTLAFLMFHDNGCTIAHIGDSRVYHIRPGKNAEETDILFQTEDHSLVNNLVKIGELTPEEAKYSKQKNVITRAMQPCMERRSKADIYHSNDIRPGDYFMLCSDGILEQMEDENLKFIFSAKGGDLSNKIDILTKATAHNHDNHSAIVVNIVDVDGLAPRGGTDPADEAQSLDAPNQKNGQYVQRETETHANRFLKKISTWIIGALLVFGSFLAYRMVSNKREPVKQEEKEVHSEQNPTRESTRNRHRAAADRPVPDLLQETESAESTALDGTNPEMSASPDSSDVPDVPDVPDIVISPNE